jgi:hypothetical protein
MSTNDAIQASNNPKDALRQIRAEVRALKCLMRYKNDTREQIFSTLNKIASLAGEVP